MALQDPRFLPMDRRLGTGPDDHVRDKVAYEHICRDHASLLVQVGLLNPAGLPVAGAEQADRLLELAGESDTA